MQADGINEPIGSAVAWGDEPMSGLDDAMWQAQRGGLFTQSLRSSRTTELSARLADAPMARTIQVYLLDEALPPSDYRMERSAPVVPGWRVAPSWVDPARADR